MLLTSYHRSQALRRTVSATQDHCSPRAHGPVLRFAVHLLQGLEVGAAVHLRVAGWRRFAVLPLDHMRAHRPTSGTGDFRVAVWITPQV